jgi:murein DD-endopeptidase MepM/ murein hydrolase activator NlpD
MIGDYRYRLNPEGKLPRRLGRKILLVSGIVVTATAGLSLGLVGENPPAPALVSEPETVTQPLALPDKAGSAEPQVSASQPSPPKQSLPPPPPQVAESAHRPGMPEPTPAQEPTAPAVDPVIAAVTPAAAEPLAQERAGTQPEPAPRSQPTPPPVTHKVRSGDTLSKIFDELGFSAALLHRIMQSDPEAERLAKIKPGQKLQFVSDADGNFSELTYVIDAVNSLLVEDGEEGLQTRLLNKQVERRTTHTSGVIASSLFADGQKAGLPESKIMEMAELFAWDIDFALELRSGDSFTVVFEEEYLDEMKFRDGPILAAEFVNRGKTYRAVRYEDPSGHVDYYSPDGNSMRKAFLRSPIKFARVSSRFSKGRKHPILGKTRAHKGVDYAAPSGTPIRAAGNGTISFRGKKGGYGKTVIIEHGNGKSTLYAHLSRYGRNKKKGKRVEQGDVIGYVGSTGMATGPHLHYEFRINGVHRDPLTVKLPIAKPIEKKYRDDFRRKTAPLMAQLDTLSRTLVADAR